MELNTNRCRYGLVCLFLLALSACQQDEPAPSTEGDTLDAELESLLTDVSITGNLNFFRLPDADDYLQIPQDPSNRLTDEKVALGQLLYHEPAIGRNAREGHGMGTYSCASCHFASAGFQAGRHQGIGEGGAGFGANGESRGRRMDYNILNIDVQPIRSPTTLNVAYQISMLWNGQFGARGPNIGTEYAWSAGTPKAVNHLGFHGVETQAIAGLSVHRQLEDTSDVSDLPGYKPLFDAAFPEVPEQERYNRVQAGLAIAAYERTLLANQAPFQRWLAGERDAMSALEKEGALLFFGKAGCVSCHTGPALNTMEFHALGMGDLDDCPEEVFLKPINAPEDLGRGGFTNRPEDMYKFKVPQLYNLKDSPFYGHGGTFRNLREVVAYKNAGVPQNEDVPPAQLSDEFIPLGLTEDEVLAITAFLEQSLYDPSLHRYEPESLPSNLCFPNNDAQSQEDLGCN
ncbi:cytochrome-c peroxidase [Phaeodactylibacter luteus]|uniref:Cytochrome-c peroxidase n=1 Tax=Phaeodactylibacter luteus TaxID=1564516 RepID=A0A5C6RMA5_9BACT|nr:cytochrome c peroxidase [Phaeodactylibacter luteus]TXB62760.1 cytochrome-c peroxidase [Phaeodactylibacter luteus]